MKTQQSRLDADELLHLALDASQKNQHEQTLGYLKQAIEIDPKNAKVHYLLGAEHAQIGMYDRAVEDMTRAVQLDPGLVTAHFQLGLLHITSGRVAEAVKAWKPLDTLGNDNPLFLFKTGMEHLARDEFDRCVECLTKGIALNKANEALNNDMRRIIDEVKGLTSKPAAAAVPATKEKPAKAPEPGHVLLSAYRKNKTDKD